jgi:hypothetical protein
VNVPLGICQLQVLLGATLWSASDAAGTGASLAPAMAMSSALPTALRPSLAA